MCSCHRRRFLCLFVFCFMYSHEEIRNVNANIIQSSPSSSLVTTKKPSFLTTSSSHHGNHTLSTRRRRRRRKTCQGRKDQQKSSEILTDPNNTNLPEKQSDVLITLKEKNENKKDVINFISGISEMDSDVQEVTQFVIQKKKRKKRRKKKNHDHDERITDENHDSTVTTLQKVEEETILSQVIKNENDENKHQHSFIKRRKKTKRRKKQKDSDHTKESVMSHDELIFNNEIGTISMDEENDIDNDASSSIVMDSTEMTPIKTIIKEDEDIILSKINDSIDLSTQSDELMIQESTNSSFSHQQFKQNEDISTIIRSGTSTTISTESSSSAILFSHQSTDYDSSIKDTAKMTYMSKSKMALSISENQSSSTTNMVHPKKTYRQEEEEFLIKVEGRAPNTVPLTNNYDSVDITKALDQDIKSDDFIAQQQHIMQSEEKITVIKQQGTQNLQYQKQKSSITTKEKKMKRKNGKKKNNSIRMSGKQGESYRRLLREWKDAVDMGVAYDWLQKQTVVSKKRRSKGGRTDVRIGPWGKNVLEWHFSINGAAKSVYENGVYHGRICLPRDYPASPPRIQMMTPNGRFHTNVDICLSASAHHPETWTPRWTILSLTEALRLHMLTTPNEIGGIHSNHREKLAQQSRTWKVYNKRNRNPIIDHESMIRQGIFPLASQLDDEEEKSYEEDEKKIEKQHRGVENPLERNIDASQQELHMENDLQPIHTDKQKRKKRKKKSSLANFNKEKTEIKTHLAQKVTKGSMLLKLLGRINVWKLFTLFIFIVIKIMVR